MPRRIARPSLPLRWRLALTLLIITALAMTLLAAILWVGVGNYERDRRIAELGDQADFYAALASQLIILDGNLQRVTPTLISRSVGTGDTAVRVFGTAGQIFGASGPTAPFPSRAAAQQLASSVPSVFLSEAPDRRYEARQVRWNGRVVGVVEVSQDIREEQRLAKVVAQVLGQAILIALGAAIIGAVIVARWLAGLIGGIRQAAVAIAEGDLEARAPLRGPAEIVELTQALNTLAAQLAERLARIEGQAQAQERFYRDVSHELRTPLMALGGYLENVEDARDADEAAMAIAAMQAEIARLGRLADELSQAQAALVIKPQALYSTSLSALVGDLVAGLQQRAFRNGVALHFNHKSPDLRLRLDPDRIKQAVLNTLDNALRATPPGGSISVTLSGAEGGVAIDIVDSGAGIPTELGEAVWQRGVRGTEGGSGLGLAIVKNIVEAHGGSVAIVPSAKGAHIRLILPEDGS